MRSTKVPCPRRLLRMRRSQGSTMPQGRHLRLCHDGAARRTRIGPSLSGNGGPPIPCKVALTRSRDVRRPKEFFCEPPRCPIHALGFDNGGRRCARPVCTKANADLQPTSWQSRRTVGERGYALRRPHPHPVPSHDPSDGLGVGRRADRLPRNRVADGDAGGRRATGAPRAGGGRCRLARHAMVASDESGPPGAGSGGSMTTNTGRMISAAFMAGDA